MNSLFFVLRFSFSYCPNLSTSCWSCGTLMNFLAFAFFTLQERHCSVSHLWSSYIHSIVVSKIPFTLNPQLFPLYPSRPWDCSFLHFFFSFLLIHQLFLFLNWFFTKTTSTHCDKPAIEL